LTLSLGRGASPILPWRGATLIAKEDPLPGPITITVVVKDLIESGRLCCHDTSEAEVEILASRVERGRLALNHILEALRAEHNISVLSECCEVDRDAARLTAWSILCRQAAALPKEMT
jgi:hypothetical protein